ncbi:MAG: rhodanese-like domain-containing protein [Ignavibacteria bacterium]|nr:rhodanese-like domain-containing protein [Ignavibacteria bacterium]
MNGELVVYIILGAILFLYGRKALVARSIQQYTPGEVQERLKRKQDLVLLDVRTDREWKGSYIKGAVHIPLHELPHRTDELEIHRNRQIVCYCQTGSRSVSAAVRLKKLGFTAANMKGGLSEWNFSSPR